jgi:hypothetical protein
LVWLLDDATAHPGQHFPMLAAPKPVVMLADNLGEHVQLVALPA